MRKHRPRPNLPGTGVRAVCPAQKSTLRLRRKPRLPWRRLFRRRNRAAALCRIMILLRQGTAKPKPLRKKRISPIHRRAARQCPANAIRAPVPLCRGRARLPGVCPPPPYRFPMKRTPNRNALPAGLLVLPQRMIAKAAVRRAVPRQTALPRLSTRAVSHRWSRNRSGQKIALPLPALPGRRRQLP